MRNPERINKVLHTIKQAWSKNPDLRLCQLLLNLVVKADTLYYVEDDVLEKAIKEVYKV